MLIAGVYVCGFTNGAVMHTAEAQLKVALLPDTITLKIKPLTADCSQGDETVDVDVTATILNSTESFSVWWSYMDVQMSNVFNTCKEKKNRICFQMHYVLPHFVAPVRIQIHKVPPHDSLTL